MRSTFAKVTAFILSGALILSGNDVISFAKSGQNLSSTVAAVNENAEESAEEQSGAGGGLEEEEQLGTGETGTDGTDPGESGTGETDMEESTSSETDVTTTEESKAKVTTTEKSEIKDTSTSNPDEEAGARIIDVELLAVDGSSAIYQENNGIYYTTENEVKAKIQIKAGFGKNIELELGTGEDGCNDEENKKPESGNSDVGDNEGGIKEYEKTVGLSEGKNEITITMKVDDEEVDAKTLIIICDTERPVLNIEDKGNYKIGDSIKFKPEDTGSGIKEFGLKIEDEEVELTEDGDGKYRFTFDESFKQTEEKQEKLDGYIFAKDKAGNVVDKTFTICFDFTGPNVTRDVWCGEETNKLTPVKENVEDTEGTEEIKDVYYINEKCAIDIKIEAEDIIGDGYASGMAKLTIEEIKDGLRQECDHDNETDGKCSVGLTYNPGEGQDYERKSYVITAKDNDGNITTEKFDIVYDCMKPELTASVYSKYSGDEKKEAILHENEYYVGEEAVIKVGATDQGSGIEEITVKYKKIDEPDTEYKKVEDSANGYKIVSVDGKYAYNCEVTDKAGNSCAIDIIVVVSTKKPEILVTYKINGENFEPLEAEEPMYGKEVEAIVRIKDNLFFEEGKVDDGNINGEWTKKGDDYEATYKFSTEGEHILQIGYTDIALNSAAIKTPTIIIDQTQPEIMAYVCDKQNKKIKELGTDAYYDASKKICLEISEEHFSEDHVQIKMLSGSKKNLFPEKVAWEQKGNTYTAYIDCAKDEIEDGSYDFEVTCIDKAGNSQKNKYQSGKFYIDKTTPVVEIGYADGVSEGEGYFNIPRTAIINVVEENFDRDTAVFLWGDGSTEKLDGNKWKVDPKEHKYTYEVKFDKDGEYAFNFSCADKAGNRAEKSGGNSFAVDQTAPCITVDFTGGDAENEKYYNGKRTATIKIKETNFSEELVNIEALDGTAKIDSVQKWSSEGDIHTATVIFDKDGVYNFKVTCMDKAGNHEEQAYESGEFIIDTIKPEVIIDYKDKGDAAQDASGDKYYKESRTLLVTVKDNNFDARTAKFIMYNSSIEVKGGEWKPDKDKLSYTCEIPLEQDGLYNFKFVCSDMAGNLSSEKECGNFIIDKTKPEIAVTYGGEEAKNGKYYKQRSVKIEIIEKNFNSQNVVFTPANGTSQIPAIENWSSVGDKHTATIIFSQDGIYGFTITCTDIAGNNAEPSYNVEEFIIDTTNPEVKIEYDKESPVNGKYFNTFRTAKVIVTDNNFDDTCVTKFDITSDSGKPKIGKWTKGKSDDSVSIQYVCEVLFEADDEYSFKFSCEDLAGNKSGTEDGGSFIIDTTRPEISVAYDNNNARNGKYYNNTRTATITIADKSFSDDLVKIEPLNASGVDRLPAISSWTADGEKHTVRINFTEDGSYGFRITCSDLADNSAKEYLGEVFIIDRASPEITFGGVKNNSANNGAAAPTLKCTDSYLDETSTQIILTGTNHGELTGTAQKSTVKDGFQLVYPDFEHTQEMDDFYTLKVRAVDLAGNETEDELNFSVNRFGSTYRISVDTQRLVNEYYTGKAPTITVTEINIDELEYGEVTISKDGQTVTLTQGSNYVVTKEGDDEDWKSYTYSIKPGNFAKDGVYSVGFYSKDKASNTSDNRIKGKEIEFALDTTAPSIVADGIESDRSYNEKSRDVTVDVKDNMYLTNLSVTDNGETILDMSEKELADNGGLVTFVLDEDDTQRDIVITAMDKVNNMQKLEYHDVLITSKTEVIKEVETSKPVTDFGEDILKPAISAGFGIPSYDEDNSLLYMVTEVMAAAVLITAVVVFYRKRRKRM